MDLVVLEEVGEVIYGAVNDVGDMVHGNRVEVLHVGMVTLAPISSAM